MKRMLMLAAIGHDKGHEKLGGRKKGTRNKGADSIKTLLNTLLPEEELAKLWKKKLFSKDPHIDRHHSSLRQF